MHRHTKLLDCIRNTARLKHLSIRTENSYLNSYSATDVRTTMIYTRVLNGVERIKSPIDFD